MRQAHVSVKIAALHLDRIDVQIGNVDVARAQTFRRPLARIRPATRMRDLVATAMGQGKRRVPASDGRQFG